MALRFLIACLILGVVSGKNVQSIPDSFYHYNHVSKPDPDTSWNFAYSENGVPAIDVVPSRPDLSDEDDDTEWQFSPLVNSNKDYLYEYVGDNWLSGEDSPYYYYSEGKSSKDEEVNKKADNEELPSKHRRKYRRLISPANKRKRDSSLNSHHKVRPARKTSQFVSSKLRRSIKLHTPNLLTNAEEVHPTMRKRDVLFKPADLAAPAGRSQKYRMSRRNLKRRRRQVKAHQLEYFTDNDGDSQLHAPGKAEGTEWDLVPLEALKDDNEEQLGIQYDKKANDASFLASE